MQIRPYEPRDEDDLLAFRRHVFPEYPYKGDREYFRWEFSRNPLGSSLDTHLLLFEREGDHIVGELATLRGRLHVGGAWHECVWLVDLIIDPAFRGGLAVWEFYRRIMELAPLALTTGATPSTLRIYDSLGWTRFGMPRSKYCILRPTRLIAIADATESGAPDRHAALRFVLPVADRLLPAAGRLLARSSRMGSRDGAVERVERFESRWDADLLRLSRRSGVTEYRTAATLNWKLIQRPVGRQEILVLRTRGGGLRGTIALKWMMRPSVARWIEVADYLVDPDDADGFRQLVRAALVFVGEHGFDFVRFRLSRPEHAALLRPPLWIDQTRPITDEVFAYSPDRALIEGLRSSPWHLTALAADRLDTGRDEWPASPG